MRRGQVRGGRRLFGQQGVAIVIVLAFVVLLSGVILSVFMRSSSARKISQSNAGSVKTELLAQSAVDTVLGDLRQEIFAGSTPIVAPATEKTVAYAPSTAATAVPFRAASHDSLPNLLKRSAKDQPFFGASGYDTANFPPSNRAAGPATTEPSADGRWISLARWNKPLLLPKQAPANEQDLSPSLGFAAPDWVVVSRDGSNPRAWDNNLKSPANDAFAVGRYAYAIYDEGGLLDANAAGYPSGATAAQRARKGFLAFADLSQIPGMTPDRINSLVGWRNYASAQPGGSFPGFTFTPAQVAAYFTSVLSHRGGFLSPLNQTVFNSQTDRRFQGRQELIRFMTQALAATPAARASAQNVLQYLGTFSRDLNQPSFTPDRARPRITGSSPATSFPSSYTGNNNSQGQDDQVNPAFLSIRVGAEFDRYDGTRAVPGEPLVKKRFPLSRLGLLTPSATADSDSLIYKYFGLTRARASDPWTYEHGLTHRVIGRLADVAALGAGAAREPDFVELLKASLLAGSLGKASAPERLAGEYTHSRDVSLDYQVIQIFANIVDQADADGFPTRIVLPNGETFAGVENLPYFYRHRLVPLSLRAPSRPVPATPRPEANVPPLADGGLGTLLLVPEVWNPHDANSSMGDPRPTEFRVVYDGGLPGLPDRTAQANQIEVTPFGGGSRPLFPSLTPFNATSTELRFRVPNAGLLREPVFLGQVGRPLPMALSVGAGHALRSVPSFSSALGGVVDVAAAPGRLAPFVGACLGTFPLRWVDPRSGQVLTAMDLKALLSNNTFTVRLECLDPNGQWVTYNTQTLTEPLWIQVVDGWRAMRPPNSFTDVAAWQNRWAQCGDPRTRRFGLSSANNPPKLIHDTASSSLHTSRADRGAGFGAADTGAPASVFPPTATDRNQLIGWAPVNTVFGAAGGATLWRPGFLAQNRTDLTNDGRRDGTPAGARTSDPIFYRDPDGVPRRAAAAYVGSDLRTPWTAETATGVPTVTATSFPGLRPTAQSQSRPIVLNRPFQSVADLGYVFRDMPWKNLDFFTPESGDTALLDVFCVEEDTNPSGLVGAKVNLNTRHAPVLQAILSGAARDEIGSLPAGAWSRTIQPALSPGEAAAISVALINRTRSVDLGRGPLRNVGELVGRYVHEYTSGYGQPYDGFSADLSLDAAAFSPNNLIQRFRETAIRALADVGTVRVWNLLIDLTAQSGRYPPGANSLREFVVEGEKRVWLHVALDRLTGDVLDRHLEVVSE
jgi:type II secretory pathway pseudopilin PulG